MEPHTIETLSVVVNQLAADVKELKSALTWMTRGTVGTGVIVLMQIVLHQLKLL